MPLPREWSAWLRLTATQPVDAAAREIEFVMAVGPSYFIEIAKLRAARLLWAQAVAAFGPKDAECLRACACMCARRGATRASATATPTCCASTTEALSAVIGGCDQLTVEPFGFDDHLAVNIQRILREEAHLDAVADPAGGSYYIEALTDSIAREAWKLFQQVEAEGGYAQALASGLIGKALAATRAARDKAMSSRRRVLVGVNNYPDLTEKTPGAEAPAGRAVPFPNTGSRSRSKKSGNAPSSTHAPPGGIRKCCCSSAAT